MWEREENSGCDAAVFEKDNNKSRGQNIFFISDDGKTFSGECNGKTFSGECKIYALMVRTMFRLNVPVFFNNLAVRTR